MVSARPHLVLQSPNHGGPRSQTRGVVLHSTRSGATGTDALSQEYDRTISWFMQPGAEASAHRVIGYVPGQHAQLVADDNIAWHAGDLNEAWLGIEFCQPRPEDPYSQWQIETGAAVVAEWLRQYGLEPSAATIVRHQDTEQGRREGKSDPGDRFPLGAFVDLVGRLYVR